MTFKNIFTSSSLLVILAACGSTAPLLQAPPQQFQSQTGSIGETQAAPKPKLNIIVVEDNSGSMRTHQSTMISGFSLFANNFLKNSDFEYKIGVVPMYDSVFLNGQQYNNDGSALCKEMMKRQMNPFGTLVPLKNSDGSLIPNAKPYVTRDTPNAIEVLKSTLALGVKCGPEDGEFYSPVLGIAGVANVIDQNQTNVSYTALQKDLDKKNAGFYDKDAYLVVIFLTDSDDVTKGMNSDLFYNTLVAAKNNDPSKVIIVAAIPDADGHAKAPQTCTYDGRGPTILFPELLQISGGTRLDLCQPSFGKQMADLGKKITEQIASVRKPISYIPNINMIYDNACTSTPLANLPDSDPTLKNLDGIIVTYGSPSTPINQRQRICRGKNGYTLESQGTQYAVVIPADVKVNRVADGEFSVTTTPVSLRNLKNGRTKVFGVTDFSK